MTTETRALDHLYQGQSNDTYWHGLFGGIYISHMRLATYEHLIAAEDLAETDAGRLHEAERLDLDLDGHDEVRLSGPGQVVSIDLAEGAGIGGWDIRPVRHNVCAVMRRRPEAYHQKLRDHVESEASPDPAPAETDAPTSIHEIFLVKEPGLAAMLHYDPYERRSGLVRFLAPGTTAESWATAEAVELGDAVEGAYEIEKLELDRLVARRDASVSIGRDGASAAVRVVKTFTLGGDRRSPMLTEKVVVTNRSESTVEAILGLEWTATMLGGGGNPAAWLEIDGERTTHDAHRTATGQTERVAGQRRHRHRDHDRDLAGGRRLVRAGRDDLEFRGRLRARLPGRRHAPDLAAVTGRRRVRTVTVRHARDDQRATGCRGARRARATPCERSGRRDGTTLRAARAGRRPKPPIS